jgi:CRISPR-associated exonuclease Cas4
LWIYDKTDGIIIYITSEREEFTFSLTRDKKMFEEVIRRVRVLSDLLKEQKTPILEPSQNCLDCQYYQRCFINKASSKQLSLAEMLGLSKEN